MSGSIFFDIWSNGLKYLVFGKMDHQSFVGNRPPAGIVSLKVLPRPKTDKKNTPKQDFFLDLDRNALETERRIRSLQWLSLYCLCVFLDPRALKISLDPFQRSLHKKETNDTKDQA